VSEFSYYKGLYKVKVLTQSEGYWIVEALEDFEDCSEGEGITVKKGEQRIVPPDTLFKQKALPPMVKEHQYELNMEKKLKRMIAEDEAEKNRK
jgi:Leu/Phe-tRNA-protein transferase